MTLEQINSQLVVMGLRRRAIACEDAQGKFIDWDSATSGTNGGIIDIDADVEAILSASDRKALVAMMIPRKPINHSYLY